MRIRLGLFTGFALGYYLGAMAGRQRYEQLNRLIRKVRGSEAYDVATDKAKAVVEVGADRAKEGAVKAKEKLHHNGSSQPSEFSAT